MPVFTLFEFAACRGAAPAINDFDGGVVAIEDRYTWL